MSEPRKIWMSLLAKAPAELLDRLWSEAGIDAPFDWLRVPETGGVMVRGRQGAVGAPFNLGEMTVTRCAVTLTQSDAVGHAFVQGRDKVKARQAALVDALMQTPQAEVVRTAILDPLANAHTATKQARAGKAAATKVDFFTMVRGE